GTECHNGAEYHNGTARFQNLLINTNTNNSTALYITQNSKALVFDACTLKDDGTYVDKGYSYTINNGQNPNGLTQQHIWYGTECHNGRITSKGGIDLIGNSLYLYATNGSTLPDNGKNYTGALWGTCGNQGIYMTILGADVGDMLSLSVKHSDNIYYGYIQFKEVGLTQPIMFYKPAYIGTLHLGSSAVVDSDRNLKKEISSLNIEEISKFIYSLNPVSYKYKKNDSDRLHHGLIAQEVKRSMENKDWGVYVDNSFNTSSSDCSLGLRYEELIPDLIATVQSQNNRIIELERQLLSLQNQVSSQGLAIQQQSLDNQLVI
ncbi:MAG TPA: hypothetical protein DCW90_11145, partial [Lachnospiraceae bacterium]|nr:hypothetical protein [Lachnospiraceae bacterium]